MRLHVSFIWLSLPDSFREILGADAGCSGIWWYVAVAGNDFVDYSGSCGYGGGDNCDDHLVIFMFFCKWRVCFILTN